MDYFIGVTCNGRLEAIAEPRLVQAEELHKQSGQRQRLFGDTRYACKKWPWERQMISKAEVKEKRRNPRFVVTHLEGQADVISSSLAKWRTGRPVSMRAMAWRLNSSSKDLRVSGVQ